MTQMTAPLMAPQAASQHELMSTVAHSLQKRQVLGQLLGGVGSVEQELMLSTSEESGKRPGRVSSESEVLSMLSHEGVVSLLQP